MQVVYSPQHLLHDPATEIESSTSHSPFEHTGRAETIKASLLADPQFAFRAPSDHGVEPITAVHDAGLVKFLSEAWAEYQQVVGARREVVPDMFYRHELRNQMGDSEEPDSVVARLGWWCFETTTPLTEGFARSGALLAQLGLPTIVLQEGGYDVEALGRNVHAWLTGFSATSSR